MQMRPSRVLRKLRAGKIACCAKINLAEPRVAEMIAMCGFDCVWLDNEHMAMNPKDMENHIRAAKIYDTDTLVRVPRGSYSDHVKPLESDATGIMVPHVMNLEDAKKVVWQTRFHPIGRRPIDGGQSDGSYTMIDIHDYVKTANEQRFVVLQIEDPEPLDDLEEIAKLEGIDMLFFGPGDFSQGIGALAQWDNQLITETRKRIAKVCKENGKFAGTVGSPANLQELVDTGYQFISIGADVVALTTFFNNLNKDFKKITGQ